MPLVRKITGSKDIKVKHENVESSKDHALRQKKRGFNLPSLKMSIPPILKKKSNAKTNTMPNQTKMEENRDYKQNEETIKKAHTLKDSTKLPKLKSVTKCDNERQRVIKDSKKVYGGKSLTLMNYSHQLSGNSEKIASTSVKKSKSLSGNDLLINPSLSDGNTKETYRDVNGCKVIMDRYRIEHKLGAGNFGVVYRVADLQLSRDSSYHVKVLKMVQVGDNSPEEAEKNMVEASLMKSCDHPSIVAYYDTFLIGGHLCIVHEHCEGGDLDKVILKCEKANTKIPEATIFSWCLQLLEGVAYIHSKSILHRDLKPRNVFLKTGSVKIGDFGISKRLMATSDMASTFTGTPYFISPEIIKHDGYSFKSDVWSLGCIFFNMVTLKRPFDAQNLMGVMFKIVEGDAPPWPADYCYLLQPLFLKMMEKDPNDRTTSHEALKLFKEIIDIEALNSRGDAIDEQSSAVWTQEASDCVCDNESLSNSNSNISGLVETLMSLNDSFFKSLQDETNQDNTQHGLQCTRAINELKTGCHNLTKENNGKTQKRQNLLDLCDKLENINNRIDEMKNGEETKMKWYKEQLNEVKTMMCGLEKNIKQLDTHVDILNTTSSNITAGLTHLTGGRDIAPDDLCRKTVLKVSNEVGTAWRYFLMAELPFSESVSLIEQIEWDKQNDLRGQSIKAVLEWRNRLGKLATFNRLILALENPDVGRKNIADSIRSMCIDSGTSLATVIG